MNKSKSAVRPFRPEGVYTSKPEEVVRDSLGTCFILSTPAIEIASVGLWTQTLELTVRCESSRRNLLREIDVPDTEEELLVSKRFPDRTEKESIAHLFFRGL